LILGSHFPFGDMAPRRPKGNVRSDRLRSTPRSSQPHRHPDLPVLASDSIAAGNVCIRKYLEEGRDWRKLTPQEVLRHFMACNLPAVSLRRPKREVSGPLIAAAAPPSSRRQGLLAAVATGILQAVDQGFYWSSDQKCEGVRIPMSRLVRLPAVKASKEVHGGAVCTVSDALAVDVCLAHAAEERKVALVRITSTWDFTVKHLEMDPLWLRSSYLKALFEMERQIHSQLSTLEEEGHAIYTSDVSLLRGPLEEGAPWLPKAHRMDVIWLNLQRSPAVSEKDHYLKEEERLRVMEKFQQLMSLAEQQGVSVLVLPPPRDVWHPSAALGEVLRDAARKTGLQQVILCKEMPEKFYGRWKDFTDVFINGIHEVVYDKDLEDRQAVAARLNLKSRSSLEALDRYVKAPCTPRMAAFPPKAETSPATR